MRPERIIWRLCWFFKRITVLSALLMLHGVLEFSKASVSYAVSALREGGFLTVDSDYVLHLTEAGRNVAEKIYERHQFFTEQFIAAGVDPEIAERDACRIEHAISQDTFEKIRDAHKQEK